MLWNFLEASHLASFFFPFLSLREKFLKILLSSSLNPSLKRSRANTAKSRRPQVSWGQQCFVWCEIITKLDNINTIMLWSLPVILVNFSFFSLHCGIFSSHHNRLVFFLFFHEGGIFFKILICLSLSPTWLTKSRAKAAKSRQPQVSRGHTMTYLMWGNLKNNSYLHNYALIVSSDLYQISVFFSLDEKIIWKLYSACLEQEVRRKATSRACLRQNENIELPWEDSCININGQ